ncbi:hypothetical protein ABT234_30740 [Streptomyces sp. NPDC001586]|uniref:hypothetical protein n=1 Tax=Streptomyces sp. NPDC001586 TaxID=3154387 RepID=UPI00332785F0
MWIRRSPQKVLGERPTDLTLAALKQWLKVEDKAPQFDRQVRALVGASHVDDVLAKAQAKWHRHLQRNGAVKESPIAYFYTICRNESMEHIGDIAKLAEQYIEDNTSSLEDQARRLHITTNGLTLVEVSDQISRALKILKEEFSPRELHAWLLMEGYQIDSSAIAEQTDTTADAVRQSVKRARTKLESPQLQHKLRGGLGLASD